MDKKNFHYINTKMCYAVGLNGSDRYVNVNEFIRLFKSRFGKKRGSRTCNMSSSPHERLPDYPFESHLIEGDCHATGNTITVILRRGLYEGWCFDWFCGNGDVSDFTIQRVENLLFYCSNPLVPVCEFLDGGGVYVPYIGIK